MFLGRVGSTLYFSISNFNFQISFQCDNWFRSVCIVSFDNGQTDSLISSANSSNSDFMSLGKLFMNIKNKKGPNTDS